MENELLSGASQVKVTLVEAVLTLLRFVGPGKTENKRRIYNLVTEIIKITIIIDDIDSCF